MSEIFDRFNIVDFNPGDHRPRSIDLKQNSTGMAYFMSGTISLSSTTCRLPIISSDGKEPSSETEECEESASI